MASKFKRVKVVIENPTTGDVRTFKSNRTTPASDCPRTNPLKQRVVIIRRRLSWKKLSKLRLKLI
jgi:hypothetical protein